MRETSSTPGNASVWTWTLSAGWCSILIPKSPKPSSCKKGHDRDPQSTVRAAPQRLSVQSQCLGLSSAKRRHTMKRDATVTGLGALGTLAIVVVIPTAQRNTAQTERGRTTGVSTVEPQVPATRARKGARGRPGRRIGSVTVASPELMPSADAGRSPSSATASTPSMWMRRLSSSSSSIENVSFRHTTST